MMDSKNIKTYTFPEGERNSEDFSVSVNGTPVCVYQARVSKAPINQLWPGYQRPINQTEIASFAYWDISGEVAVEVVSKEQVDTVSIKPSSYDIKPEVKDKRIAFKLTHPCQITVEVNGIHRVLHLFINPVEDYKVSKEDPKIRYFGPGVHHAGKIVMNSGEMVYIDAGAVVYGCIEAKWASDIRILGRGILDTSRFERFDVNGSISLYKCSRVEINGIIIRDSNAWTVISAGCEHVNIANAKLIGLWRYNSDGIDVVNSQHVKIEKCFVRAYDDCIVIKGLKDWSGDRTDDRNVNDVVVSGCVLWCDWGRTLEIGAETCADEISDIVFEDCDIIRTNMVALDIQHGDRALIKNVRYEDIRFEIDDFNLRPLMQTYEGEQYVINPEDDFCPEFFVIELISTIWSRDNVNGNVKNISVKNVKIYGKQFPQSKIYGLDDTHTVDNVTFENVRFNGAPVESTEGCQLDIGKYTHNIKFV